MYSKKHNLFLRYLATKKYFMSPKHQSIRKVNWCSVIGLWGSWGLYYLGSTWSEKVLNLRKYIVYFWTIYAASTVSSVQNNCHISYYLPNIWLLRIGMRKDLVLNDAEKRSDSKDWYKEGKKQKKKKYQH